MRHLVSALLVLAVVVPAGAQDAEKRRGFSIHIVAPAADEFVVSRTRAALFEDAVFMRFNWRMPISLMRSRWTSSSA